MRADASDIPSSRVLVEPQAIPTSLSVPAERIAGIDRLRIVAAIGIVWFHTDGAPHREIGYAGLPMFLLIFFSLITRQDSGSTITHFLKRRWNRLLKPWLFWSAVYGLCHLAKAMHTMDVRGLSGMFSIGTLLTGTNIHLWYLPYAFVSGLLAYELSRRTLKANHVLVAVMATVIGMLALAACAIGTAIYRLPNPIAQWEFGLATIPLGFAIGRCLAIPSRSLQKILLAGISLGILIEGRILQSLNLSALVIPYGIAVVSICIAYCWETRKDIITTALAPLTFGIYLIHPLVIFALQHCLSPSRSWCLFISLTVCISAMITLVLMKTPIKRFL